MIGELAVTAIESGNERITDAMVERWKPLFQGETAVA